MKLNKKILALALTSLIVGCDDSEDDSNSPQDGIVATQTKVMVELEGIDGEYGETEYCEALDAEVYLNDAEGKLIGQATLDGNATLDLASVPDNGFITYFNDGYGTEEIEYTSIQKEALYLNSFLIIDDEVYTSRLGNCVTLDEDPNVSIVNPEEVENVDIPDFEGIPASILGEEYNRFAFGNTNGGYESDTIYGVSQSNEVTIDKSVFAYPVNGDITGIQEIESPLLLQENSVLIDLDESNPPEEGFVYAPDSSEFVSMIANFRGPGHNIGNIDAFSVNHRAKLVDGQFNVNLLGANEVSSVEILESKAISFKTETTNHSVIISEYEYDTGEEASLEKTHMIYQVTSDNSNILVELPDQWKIAEYNKIDLYLIDYLGNPNERVAIMADLHDVKLDWIEESKENARLYNEVRIEESYLINLSPYDSEW